MLLLVWDLTPPTLELSRHVRTEAGVRRYRLPIGSLIGGGGVGDPKTRLTLKVGNKSATLRRNADGTVQRRNGDRKTWRAATDTEHKILAAAEKQHAAQHRKIVGPAPKRGADYVKAAEQARKPGPDMSRVDRLTGPQLNSRAADANKRLREARIADPRRNGQTYADAKLHADVLAAEQRRRKPPQAPSRPAPAPGEGTTPGQYTARGKTLTREGKVRLLNPDNRQAPDATTQDLVARGYAVYDPAGKTLALTPAGRAVAQALREGKTIPDRVRPKSQVNAEQAAIRATVDRAAVDAIATERGIQPGRVPALVAGMSDAEIDALPRDQRRRYRRVQDMLPAPAKTTAPTAAYQVTNGRVELRSGGAATGQHAKVSETPSGKFILVRGSGRGDPIEGITKSYATKDEALAALPDAARAYDVRNAPRKAQPAAAPSKSARELRQEAADRGAAAAARQFARADAAAASSAGSNVATTAQVDHILRLLARRRRNGDGGGFMRGPTTAAGIAKLSRRDASAYITSLTESY